MEPLRAICGRASALAAHARAPRADNLPATASTKLIVCRGCTANRALQANPLHQASQKNNVRWPSSLPRRRRHTRHSALDHARGRSALAAPSSHAHPHFCQCTTPQLALVRRFTRGAMQRRHVNRPGTRSLAHPSPRRPRNANGQAAWTDAPLIRSSAFVSSNFG